MRRVLKLGKNWNKLSGFREFIYDKILTFYQGGEEMRLLFLPVIFVVTLFKELLRMNK